MSALPATLLAGEPEADPRRHPAPRRLSCEVARSLEAVRHLQPEWDRLVESLGCGVSLSYDWCRVWWDHYAGQREARVFLFRSGDELVSVLPTYIDRVWIGPLSVRVARIMGSEFTQAICDLPVGASWARVVFDRLLEQLICDDRCDAIAFGPFPDACDRISALRAAAGGRPDLVSILRDRAVTRHATIALPDTFDEYLKSLAKKQRSNIRRGWKRLTADFNVTVDLITDEAEALDELDDLVRMHGKQWQRRGRLGHFGDWPNAVPFNRSLVTAMSGQGRVRFLRVRADGRVIARQYGLVFGDTCHWRLPARATEPRWNPYGLGCLSLSGLIEHLIHEGVRTIDAGVGHYDYKLRLGGMEQPIRSILVAANRAGVRRRLRVFCLLADTLDRAYYRLWFCRIAPHLPGRRRPLSKTWIRSRL